MRPNTIPTLAIIDKINIIAINGELRDIGIGLLANHVVVTIIWVSFELAANYSSSLTRTFTAADCPRIFGIFPLRSGRTRGDRLTITIRRGCFDSTYWVS